MPTHAPHILIMDDTPAILELLRDVLEDEGYRVTTTTTLLDVAHISALAPDCVLLEWRFGEQADAGWRHILRLRLDPALTWLPLVVCTTADCPSRDPHIAATLARLQVAVIPKPFALDDLLGVMRHAMRAPHVRALESAGHDVPIESGVTALDAPRSRPSVWPVW